MFNDDGLGEAMARSHSDSRLDILEKRQVLLLRALRGEWKGAQEGDFEAAWNALDHRSPAPKWERGWTP